MSSIYYDGIDSLLCKTVGMYQTTIVRKETGQKTVYHIIVMENVFDHQEIKRTFDLKGSLRNRYVKSSERRVQLDGNFVEFTQGHPLGIWIEDYNVFLRSIRNDTIFLNSIHIIDFSLIVGFGGGSNDTEFSHMSVGIIDYLRQFDLIKRVESVGKSVGMIAGQSSPTIIEPSLYSKRFQDAMQRYFMPITPITSNRNQEIHD